MNVPKLRFREFTDEWNIKKIKDVAIVVGGGTPSTAISEYWNGNIQWFTPSEVGENKYVFQSKRKITQQGLTNSSAKLLPTGTILLSSRATVGEASILLHEASTNQGFQSLIVNKENNNEFIYYLTTKIKKDILTKSFGSTFLEISKSNLEKISFKIPTINEQNKIANMLQLLDKKIELQSKEIEALKLYKICTINNVFKTSDNSIYLKKLCNVKTSNISLNDIENDIGNYPLYGANGYIKNISSYQFNNDYVAIIKDGAGVGKTYICCKNSSILGTMNALFPIDIDINYLNILLTRIKFKKYIVGSGIPHIYFKDYKNELIKIHEKETQEIIGNYIEKLNSKILYEEKKYNKLIKLKKGLMQNMFI